MRLNRRKIFRCTVIYGLFFLVILYVYNHGRWMAENEQDDFNDRGKRDTRKFNKKVNNFNTSNTLTRLSIKHLSDIRKNTAIKNIKEAEGTKTTSKPNGNVKQNDRPVIHWRSDDISRITQINDVFITVKTTDKFHKTRVQLLLDTWWMFAREQTYFFTDSDDSELYRKTKGHFVNTNCSSGHERNSLCCKMSVEFDYFILSNKRWFCHVDDDTYVNIPTLLEHLQKYNHSQGWYLGKPSLNHPIEVGNPDDHTGPKISFWFATGGAGFCISRPLAVKMVQYAGGGRLKHQCLKIRLPDDCTMGFIIEHYLHEKLTVIPEFHSHLEGLWMLRPHQLHKQVAFDPLPLESIFRAMPKGKEVTSALW